MSAFRKFTILFTFIFDDAIKIEIENTSETGTFYGIVPNGS